MKLVERLEWGKYVTPLSDKDIPPYNWYSFKHRFGSELASIAFSEFGLSKGDTVFDPFLGGSTTLIKAKLDGYNAEGLDISPFSVFLSHVLTTSYSPAQLEEILKEIQHEVDPDVAIPDVAILDKAFSGPTLKYIYSLRNSINKLKHSERDFFLFSLLSMLNNISKAKKSGGFLRITDQKRVSAKTAQKMFMETSEKLIKDISLYNFSGSSVKALLGDARNYPDSLKNVKYDAILTSPPYPNRHDYTRIYELELLVGFINSNRSLKSLRYDTLRSHIEAKKRYDAKGYNAPSLLEQIMNEIKSQDLNNAQVVPTLYGYFEDMYLCLKEMHRVLKKGKCIGLVVSNVRYAGVVVPVDELLSEIGEQVGLKTKSIYVLRYRGNSSQQMLRHKRTPVRESLIIWEK
jgi:DNA modification methylase